MTVREQIVELDDPEIILYDGLDEALVGVAERNSLGPLAVYDEEKIMELLMTRDGMDWETAADHLGTNIAGGYCGERTPLIFTRMGS